MKKLIIMLILCLCIFTQLAKATEQESYWTKDWQADAEHDQCMQKAQINAEMISCNRKAIKAWNLILDKEYKLLYYSASPIARESLKKAEMAWINYRDSYLKFENDFYRRDGTAYQPYLSLAELSLARDKAIMLMIEWQNIQQKQSHTTHNHPAKRTGQEVYQWTKNCLKTQSSIVCYTKAEKKWHAVLNKEFKGLYNSITDHDGYIGVIPATIKKELRNSQQAWIRYRNSYNKFLDDYYNHPGEQWRRAKARSKMRVVQYKAMSLRAAREAVCLTDDCIKSIQ